MGEDRCELQNELEKMRQLRIGAHDEQVRSLLADFHMKLDAKDAKNESCESQFQKLHCLMQASSSLFPELEELAKFIAAIPQMPCSDKPVLIPVQALRLTHHSINADFAFGDDHENRQESIFKLFLNYFWGRLDPADLEEPLCIFKHVGPDGKVGLYSRNNRRLTALLMFQAIRRDSIVYVPCKVFADDDCRACPVDGRKSLARWFREGYDTEGEREGCNGLGLSIWARSERASHRGYPILNPAQTTLQALSKASQRARCSGTVRPEVVEALGIVQNAAHTDCTRR